MAMMWRPDKASRGVLCLVAGISLLGYLLVEGLPRQSFKRNHAEKRKAAERMAQGMEVIRQARFALFGKIDLENDPNATGLIGTGLTPITSKNGELSAKQTAANPNFAAVLLALYKKAGLKEGDVVALAFSGSFPSLNLASLCAAEVLGLKPIAITSLSASTWGANEPLLTWLDMERLLYERGIVHSRSVAASLGGERDRGGGIPPEGIQLLREAIKRNGVELIDPPDQTASFDLRMNIYQEEAKGQPIKCYVNVGGGAGSVGSPLVKKLFASGLNLSVPHPGHLRDSVMTRMSKNGVPIIHLVQTERMAQEYGLPIKPEQPPRVGEGGVFVALGYDPWLTAAVLVGLLVIIFLLLRMDYQHYFLRLRGLLPNGQAQKPSPGSGI